MATPAGIKFGHFTLGKRLARGGMAEVFLARQRGPEGFDRRVAVKRILPHLAETPDFVRMFLDEARLAARLSHPNVVHIYELGQVDGDYFIAMEFVDGIHAGQLVQLAAGDPLPPVLVARLGADAAGALAYAHRLEDVDGRPLHLVHRDVSPHNLMVSFDGVVKLVDFGIAKAALKADETRPGIVKGKYAYMSPEQTVGRSLDGRSDVFSLGICLWEIVAGRTIVDRTDVVEAMKVIRDGRWQPIEKVAPRTPPALAQAIGWALAHKRDDRATAAQLQVALEEFIKSSPQIATSGQLAEWIRPRFPRAATGAAPIVDDAAPPRPGRRTAPPALAPVGTAANLRAQPARASTEPVVITGDAPAIRPGGTAVVPISGRTGAAAVPPPAPAASPDDDDDDLDAGKSTIRSEPGARAISADAARARSSPSGRVIPADPGPRAPEAPPRAPGPIAAPAPPRPPRPPRGRAPTHLDEVDVGADAPTRRHLPTAMGAELPRSRWPLIVGVLLALAAGVAIAIVIAGGLGGHRAAAIDAAPPPPPGPDGAPEVVALPEPVDAAAPVDAPPDDAAPALDAADDDDDAATLEIITRPSGARVRVGSASAPTPAALTLAPGRVTFAVTKDGFTPIERTVTLAAGEHRTVELDLDRRGGGGSSSRPSAEVGYLTVRTSPYSIVTLAGKPLGETPFASVPLPVGTHVLTFTNPDRRPVKRTVTIRAGQTLKLSFALP